MQRIIEFIRIFSAWYREICLDNWGKILSARVFKNVIKGNESETNKARKTIQKRQYSKKILSIKKDRDSVREREREQRVKLMYVRACIYIFV